MPIPYGDATERQWRSLSDPELFGQRSYQNPGGANPQARAAYDEMLRNNARAAPTSGVAPAAPAAPSATPPPAAVAAPEGAPARGVLRRGADWAGRLGGAAGAAVGKASVLGGVGYGTYGATKGLADGNYGDAALGAADAAASASLVTPAAPIGATWLGARAAHGILRSAVDSREAQDVIGGTINALGQKTGLWGVDDSAYLQQKAEQNLRNPAPTAAAPRADPRNPYATEPARAGFGGPPAPSGPPQAPGQPAARPGDVLRNGNEYSGTNVSGDITINGMPSGFGLGRGSVISPQNMGAADALSERDRMRSLGAVAAQQAATSQATGFQAPVVRSSLNDWEIRNNLRNARISAGSSMSDLWNKRFGSREQRARMSPEMAEYMTLLAADKEALGAQPGVDLETGKSNNTLRGDIFKAQSSADAARYTSDNSLRGDIFKAQSSAATARQSALTAAQKDTLERSDKQYEAGQKRLDEIFTTAATHGGEVNPQMLNRYRTGVTAYLGNAVAEARKRGDEETARAIEREGPSALARDPVLLRKYMAQMELDDIGRGDSGYLRTDNPGGLAITGQTPGILGLGRKYEVTDARGNKSYVSRNAVDYENGGPFTNWNPWATRTDRADLLKQRN